MYRATIKDIDGNVALELQSEDRKLMRALDILCGENGLSCEVVVDVTPRVVTFKGVGLAPAADAKADAKADIKAATREG